MTREEMGKVVAIFTKADGGCPSCVRELLASFRKTFDEYTTSDIINAAVAAGFTRVGPDDLEE